jgi:formate/nitrite transporter FocA (FNT family)
MSGPRPQYLSADHVLEEMVRFGTRRLRHASLPQLLVLAVVAGLFIGAGALFSVLLTAGRDPGGAYHLLAGLGFSAGFFFVVLSEAALTEVVDKKMAYARLGTGDAWLRAAVSGVLANAFVGMAAFFATMGRTIVGEFVPVFLAVTLFVTASFQYAPANMGYFGLAVPQDLGPGWAAALAWNVVPVGLGNMLGGTLLVVLPFWYALRPDTRSEVRARVAGGAAGVEREG